MLRKASEPWRSTDLLGNHIDLRKLHPKALAFLTNPGAQIVLQGEHSAYVHALLAGEDLSPWHESAAWQERPAHEKGRSQRQRVGAVSAAAQRMAKQAFATAAVADGRELQQVAKVKQVVGFTFRQLRTYIQDLIEKQNGRCALTNLPLQYDEAFADIEMLASLDRIDSDRHYEVGNLQVVCRFANRWKGSSSDMEFRRLLAVLKRAAA